MKKQSEESLAYLAQAVELARQNVARQGGPFGALIVKDGKILATGVNQVTQKNDPTAHAEVEAIRNASEILGSYDLKGCILYSSCEPCPMCLGAIYWARLDAVFYASTREDAHRAGFSDAVIYEEIGKKPSDRFLSNSHLCPANAGSEFVAWENQADKTTY